LKKLLYKSDIKYNLSIRYNLILGIILVIGVNINSKSMDSVQLKLVFFGEQAMGKSTTLNSILRTFSKTETFTPDDGVKEIIVRKCIRENNNKKMDLTLIECPEPDDDWSESMYIDRIFKPLDKLLEEGITLFVLLNNFTYLKPTKSTKSMMYKMFGYIIPRDMLSRCIILTADADLLTDKAARDNYYYNYCKELNNVLQNFYPDIKTNSLSIPVYFLENKTDPKTLDKSILGLFGRIMVKWRDVKECKLKFQTDMPNEFDTEYIGCNFIKACNNYVFI
jgi:hypothetical protein